MQAPEGALGRGNLVLSRTGQPFLGLPSHIIIPMPPEKSAFLHVSNLISMPEFPGKITNVGRRRWLLSQDSHLWVPVTRPGAHI